MTAAIHQGIEAYEHYNKGIWGLAGDSMKDTRQRIMHLLTGRWMPKAKCGVTALEVAYKAAKASIAASEHTKDSDCTVNPETLLCSVCGVAHGDECLDCGGRGFHKESCETLQSDICEECGVEHGLHGCDEIRELVGDEQHEDTDSLEDRGITLGSYAS